MVSQLLNKNSCLSLQAGKRGREAERGREEAGVFGAVPGRCCHRYPVCQRVTMLAPQETLPAFNSWFQYYLRFP